MTLLDDVLPVVDVSHRHRIALNVAAERAASTMRTADLNRSRLVRALFAVRGLPSGRFTLASFERVGFGVLAETPLEVVVGVVGRPWRPRGDLRRLDPAAFAAFDEPGYAKMAMALGAEPAGPDACHLVTETRVRCTDDASRRAFLRYWRVVGPFSALIRTRMLRAVEAAVNA